MGRYVDEPKSIHLLVPLGDMLIYDGEVGAHLPQGLEKGRTIGTVLVFISHPTWHGHAQGPRTNSRLKLVSRSSTERLYACPAMAPSDVLSAAE